MQEHTKTTPFKNTNSTKKKSTVGVLWLYWNTDSWRPKNCRFYTNIVTWILQCKLSAEVAFSMNEMSHQTFVSLQKPRKCYCIQLPGGKLSHLWRHPVHYVPRKLKWYCNPKWRSCSGFFQILRKLFWLILNTAITGDYYTSLMK